MNERITQLEAIVAELQKKLDSFDSSSALPLKFDQAIQGRGFSKQIGSKKAITTQVISIGAGGGSFNQPVVTYTIPLTINGVVYNVLFQ